MWPDRESNPGPLIYESGALPTALYGPASFHIRDTHTIWKLYRYTIYHLFGYIAVVAEWLNRGVV